MKKEFVNAQKVSKMVLFRCVSTKHVPIVETMDSVITLLDYVSVIQVGHPQIVPFPNVLTDHVVAMACA